MTISKSEEDAFWIQIAQISLDAIWDNEEDDIYEQLLENSGSQDD